MRAIFRLMHVCVLVMILATCGGDGSTKRPPAAPVVTVDADIKQLTFSWTDVRKATRYRLMENPDGHSGFTQIGVDIPTGTTSATRHIAVHLHDWLNALYMVQACNEIGCTGSTEVSAANVMLDTVGYLKSSNIEGLDRFGERCIGLSADGSTIAVGAGGEDSQATGINGDQNDNSVPRSGAVYVFRFDGTEWIQQAYIKASNTDSDDNFGYCVALSADGKTLAVGANNEESNASGINGDQDNNLWSASGAVYIFRYDGATWVQQAYIKASNPHYGDRFANVSLSADGNTLAVGAHFEDSNATGIDGNQLDRSLENAGSAYVFRFDGTKWFQQAYIKASNTDSGDEFGWPIALSADGDTLAVGAAYEASNATGIDGDQSVNSMRRSGAVYLFRFDRTSWSQQAYIKPSIFNGYRGAVRSLSLSSDGNLLAVAGLIVSLYLFDGSAWSLQAHVMSSDAKREDVFGETVALSGDGNTLAVGAYLDDSSATGIDGDPNDMAARDSGAVYVFRFDDEMWSQQAYVKASNTENNDRFGYPAVALSQNGQTLAVSAKSEDGGARGINGDQTDNSAYEAGAAYIY